MQLVGDRIGDETTSVPRTGDLVELTDEVGR
jgi:hypothetical protein